MIRRVGFMLLAVAAIAVFLFAGPDADEIGASTIEAAISNAETNEDSASGAPQQAVVNGWVARDLLEVIAHQGQDNRTPALLLIGVLALILHASTLPKVEPDATPGAQPLSTYVPPAPPSTPAPVNL